MHWWSFGSSNGAKYFNQIDLKSEYYQIHVVDEDVEKMAMKTKYGSYEFLAMSFRLCSALWTPYVTTVMNSIFNKKLNEFMIIYINDIFVYSKTVEEHVEHLKYVLNKFHENKLFANKVKSEFDQKEMDFLGHIFVKGRGEAWP